MDGDFRQSLRSLEKSYENGKRRYGRVESR